MEEGWIQVVHIFLPFFFKRPQKNDDLDHHLSSVLGPTNISKARTLVDVWVIRMSYPTIWEWL